MKKTRTRACAALAFTTLIAFFNGCSDQSPIDSEIQNYAAYDKGSHITLLSHTDYLDPNFALVESRVSDTSAEPVVRVPQELTERMHRFEEVGRDHYDHFGQCHYLVKSDNPIDLSDPEQRRLAYLNAQPLTGNSRFIGIGDMIQLIRSDEDLRKQLLNSALPWWIYLLSGGYFAAYVVGSIDASLHHMNSTIVKNGELFLQNPKVKNSKNYDIYRAVVAAAAAEQSLDEWAQTAFRESGGGKKSLHHRIAESDFAHKLADKAERYCRGSKAFGCTLAYTGLFAAITAGLLPIGIKLTDQAAKPFMAAKEKSFLHDMMTKTGPHNQVQRTNSATISRIMRRIEEKQPALQTRHCPEPSAIAALMETDG